MMILRNSAASPFGRKIRIAIKLLGFDKDVEIRAADPTDPNDDLRQQMKFLDWAPMVAISALNGQRVDKILPLVAKANKARNYRVPTSQLNKFFEESVSQPRGGSAPAPVKGGVSRLKIQYITQGGLRPPLSRRARSSPTRKRPVPTRAAPGRYNRPRAAP